MTDSEHALAFLWTEGGYLPFLWVWDILSCAALLSYMQFQKSVALDFVSRLGRGTKQMPRVYYLASIHSAAGSRWCCRSGASCSVDSVSSASLAFWGWNLQNCLWLLCGAPWLLEFDRDLFMDSWSWWSWSWERRRCFSLYFWLTRFLLNCYRPLSKLYCYASLMSHFRQKAVFGLKYFLIDSSDRLSCIN